MAEAFAVCPGDKEEMVRGLMGVGGRETKGQRWAYLFGGGGVLGRGSRVVKCGGASSFCHASRPR